MADENGFAFGTGRTCVELRTFVVAKVTPRGVRLTFNPSSFAGWSRLVLNNSRKQFACPTKAEAFESFRQRKMRQIAILKSKLNRAIDALESADRAPL